MYSSYISVYGGHPSKSEKVSSKSLGSKFKRRHPWRKQNSPPFASLNEGSNGNSNRLATTVLTDSEVKHDICWAACSAPQASFSSSVRSSTSSPTPYDRGSWFERHYVLESDSNHKLPACRRRYFDHMPKMYKRLQRPWQSTKLYKGPVWKKTLGSKYAGDLEEQFCRSLESPSFSGWQSPSPDHLWSPSRVAFGEEDSEKEDDEDDLDSATEIAKARFAARSRTMPSRLMDEQPSQTSTSMTYKEGRKSLEEQMLEDFEDLKRRQSTTPAPKHSEQKLQAFTTFMVWCLKKYKNLTRCWRLLDTHMDMKLTYMEFVKGLKDQDFPGDARQIFQILDRDRSGNWNIFHFDPQGALQLAAFVAWSNRKFGGVKEAFARLDKDRNGKLTFPEVRDGCRELGFAMEGPISYLFHVLDLDRDREVVLQELEFLDVWNIPPWMLADPDHEGAADFKRRVIAKFRNYICAWRFGFDKDGRMRLSWHEFEMAGQKTK